MSWQTKPGETVKLEFRNKKLGNLVIHKLSSADKSPIEGAQFCLEAGDGKGSVFHRPVGADDGAARAGSPGQVLHLEIENLDPTLTLVVKETRQKEGYLLDDAPQTIKTKPGDWGRWHSRGRWTPQCR